MQFDKYKEAELQKLARAKQEHEKSLKAERLYWEKTKKAQLLFPNKKYHICDSNHFYNNPLK